jgi:hypothetical protein
LVSVVKAVLNTSPRLLFDKFHDLQLDAHGVIGILDRKLPIRVSGVCDAPDFIVGVGHEP